MKTVTARWANPPSTTASSRFSIEAVNEHSNYFSGSQMATSPYASPSATMNGTVNYGDSIIPVIGASAFSGSGYLVMEDALIGYGSHAGSLLNSASWFSGYGTYVPPTVIRQAHESCELTVPDVDYVIFYIQHKNNLLEPSQFSRIMCFTGLNPAYSNICNVIVLIRDQYGNWGNDGEEYPNIVRARMNNTLPFISISGDIIINNETVNVGWPVNADGVCVMQCYKNEFVEQAGGGPALGYTFIFGNIELKASFIPNMPYVMLSNIVDAQ